jgi:predicted nucleic acid-binding protein
MEKLPRLFFDTSVLVAAAASQEGGSALLLKLCSQGRAKALVTRLILREAERNIMGKLSEETLLRYYRLLGVLDPELVPLPSPKAIGTAGELVTAKDAHVLAGAPEGQATHLITLDRKHLLLEQVRHQAMPIIICTPGDYLQELLEDRA